MFEPFLKKSFNWLEFFGVFLLFWFILETVCFLHDFIMYYKINPPKENTFFKKKIALDVFGVLISVFQSVPVYSNT